MVKTGGYCDNPFCRKFIEFGENFVDNFVQCPWCGEISEVKRTLGGNYGR